MTKKLNKAQLEKLVELLKWNQELGCYTRQAFENVVWPEISSQAVWLVFFDVDGMKELNSRGSWDETSALIKRSIVMRSSDYVAGQVLSGDEFVVAISNNSKRDALDPRGLCQRILANFHKEGASATFAFGKITSTDLQENLKPLKDLVQAAKEENRRGSILSASAV